MNQFDKIFKNKLEHHTVDVPAGSWENIASRLPQQKKQLRPLVPIMFISFGMIVLVGAILFSWYTMHTEKIDGVKTTTSSMTQDVASIEFKSSELALLSESNASNDISTTNINNSTQSTRTSTATSAAINESNIVHANVNESSLSSTYNPTFSENVATVEEIENRSLVFVDALENKLINSKFPLERRIKYATPFKQNSKPAKACPFDFDTRDKSVDVYFSHDYAHKTIEPNGGESQGYLNMRNLTEKSMYSYSVGARFGYNLSYRWNLHTGFNYSQINEKFEYTDPESNQTRLITIKDYVYENGKIVDSIITEEIVVVPGTEKLKVYNKFRSFDIPIIARFTLLANRHLSLSATAGVYVNLGFSQRGMMLGEHSNSPVDFTSGKENAEIIYKTQLGLSAYGGVSLAYHLTSNVDFVLEPHVRLQTENMTVGDYALKQNFNTFGLATGLRYKF